MDSGIRVFWLLAGLTSVAIGAVGVALPLLPTTPVITWLFDAPLWVIISQIVVLSAAAIFIVTRPTPSEGHRK